MNYGSVCSGVEAATVAWRPLGWEPAWFCEFDKFPSAALAHHYPNIPNLGDMTKIEGREEYRDRSIDLLVGGTPCQSFSVAGLRKGLDDDRGNLALKYCQILRDKRPRWFVWENVPGVLSSNEGRDFAAIIRGFRECGYGFAYRVLDAQYFGVAQRRRRVFVVGHLGDWRCAAAVLFERQSVQGYPEPSREKRERIAPSVTTGPPFSRTGNERVEADAMIPVKNGSHWDGQAHPSLSQSHNTGGIGQSNQELFSQRGAGLVAARMAAFGEYEVDGTASTIKARDYKGATDLICSVHGTQDPDVLEGCAHTLARNNRQENAVCGAFKAGQMAVRRLTPVECERLQGFPDNYTRIPWRGKPEEDCPDGHRYKAMGNSMAVPVMRWIGGRIKKVEAILEAERTQ